MSWRVSDPMSERVKLVGLLTSGQRSVAALSREFGVSRKTAYKWLERFREGGIDGLKERSRATKTCPHQTSEEIRDLLIKARKQHSTWGPEKLKHWLVDTKNVTVELPAASTIGAILDRAGLVRPRRLRRRTPMPTSAMPQEATEPNQEWDTDFKGQFRMSNGRYCYPLTLTDAHSRFLLGVRALEGTGTVGARRFFESAFEEFGLPGFIRSDNGGPFASPGLGGLSKLSVWWIRLGITPLRGRPGHPQDNGRHERMHRTLKAETTRPPEATTDKQQKRFDAFRREFNHERPHEALSHRSPAKIYRPSPRPYPKKLAEVEYPAHYETRKVDYSGMFRFKDKPTFISETLGGERIGLIEIEDHTWRVYYGSIELGILDLIESQDRKTGRVLPMCPV